MCLRKMPEHLPCIIKPERKTIMTKKKIEIFTKEVAASGGGCGCSCSSGCCGSGTTAYIDMEVLKERFEAKYVDAADITIDDMNDQDSETIMAKLNEILKFNKEPLVVTANNYDFVLSKIMPLITIDGNIVSSNSYPDENQLYQSVMTGEIIPRSGGCC